MPNSKVNVSSPLRRLFINMQQRRSLRISSFSVGEGAHDLHRKTFPNSEMSFSDGNCADYPPNDGGFHDFIPLNSSFVFSDVITSFDVYDKSSVNFVSRTNFKRWGNFHELPPYINAFLEK